MTLQAGEEVIESEDEQPEEKEGEAPIDNVITIDEIMKQTEQNESQDDFVDIDTGEGDEDYHDKFVEEIRKKEQLD